MLSIQTNVKQFIRTQAQLVRNADENIRFALVEMRNDTIELIKDGLDDPNMWTYAGEHLPGAVGRDGGSQVRTTPTSDSFAFIKQTQPMGKTPFFNFKIENGSPEGIGEFLLSGTSPHVQEAPDNAMVWSHFGGAVNGSSHFVSHPGAESRFDDIVYLAGQSHRAMFDFWHGELVSQGDGIFGTITKSLGGTMSKQVKPRIYE